MGTFDTPPALIPSQLLTEALGFSLQLLLDDIIDVANHAVQDGQRAAQLGETETESTTQEIEQGLVALKTLLEFHTDAWSLRNIFAVPADLPLLVDTLAPYESTAAAATSLPAALLEMQKSVSTLPELTPATMFALAQLRVTEAGKRQWETGTTGYINWAVEQLRLKAKEDGEEELLPDLANTEMYRRASAAMEEVSKEMDGGDVVMEE
ncbi:hypothetical protein K438DRAFT_1819697 [Mycena galopus ATCC 62051]|nr:hypothetical protein K438DRAFT_1819697 [Mycena galopus ATCC 62051]